MIYDFTYHNPTRIHFGKNALNHLAGEIQAFGQNVLLIYGKASIKKTGLYDQILHILQQCGKQVTELSGINSNPRWTQVEEGCRLVRENQIDFILAAGGGSVIDCAKAISACSYATGDAWSRYYVHQLPVDNPVIPIGAILTMAGTGSEMNSGSVITNEEQKLKLGRVYDTNLNPQFSLLNPEFTYTVPTYQMISGIFDIFSHLMEQYFSGADDNTSDYLMEGAMRSLIVSARAAVKNEKDYEARSNIMWCAAVALNKILGVSKKQDWMVHQIEHQLGAYTDCAHGIGLAVITPSYLRHILPDGLDKLVRYAKNIWDVRDDNMTKEQTAEEGIARLEAFIHELGLPTTLREVGATEEMLPLIAETTRTNVIARFGKEDTLIGFKRLCDIDIMNVLKACY